MKECIVPDGYDPEKDMRDAGFNDNLPISMFQSKNSEATVYQQKEGDEWIEHLLYRISELEERLRLLE